MTKTRYFLIFILFFLTIEIASHFYLGIVANILFKACISVLVFLLYFTKIEGKLNQSDKLFFSTILVGFVGEVFFVFQKTEITSSFLIFLYLVEHQIYITLLRPSSLTNINAGNLDLLKKGWPYIILAFLFFGFFLMEIIPDSVFVLMIFYVFQFTIMGAYSLMLVQSKRGKKYIIVGVILLAISDVLSSYYVFIGIFAGSYIYIRSIYVFSKVLLAIGFVLNRNCVQTNDISHWDMEDK